jgi:16S rRNA (guanine(1405)-N(7))-methyltransferase
MSELTKFIQEITSSKKYRAICTETVQHVIEQEIGNHGTLKKAMEPARERLHKLWGEYLGVPNYKALQKSLDDAFASGDDARLRQACREVMLRHISTRERIPLIEEGYYQTIFEHTGRPQKLADFACALNPFSFRWMGLPGGINYFAYDINKNYVDFIAKYFSMEGLQPLIFWQDIYVNTPGEHFDVVLLFKMYHCLEHRCKGAGLELLKKINADWVAVSFPSQNIHGRKADIAANYQPRIMETAAELNWEIQQLNFLNETLLLIKK